MPRLGRIPVLAERFEEKFCPRCGETKPLAEFHKSGGKASVDQRLNQSPYCKPCASAWAKEYNARPETRMLRRKWKIARKLRTYGLTPASYEEILIAQGRRCGICLKPYESGQKFVVDHSHESGKVRGLLCTQCNVGIGMFKDDIGTLASAIAYIEDSRKENSN